MTRKLAMCLVLLTGCGRSILILPAAGDGDVDSSTDDPSTLTIGEDNGESICGDGIADGDELCDGSDLAGWSCEELGFDGGELVCTSSCTLDASACGDIGPGTASSTSTGPGTSTSTTGDGDGDTGGDGDGDVNPCGNDVIDPGEECDGADFGGLNCVDLGFGPGLPLCVDCMIDTSTCPEDPNEGAPCGWNQPCPNGYNCVSGNCYDGSPGDPCGGDLDCDSSDCMNNGQWGQGTCN